MKILAGLAFLRSLLNLFGVGFGEDDDFANDESEQFEYDTDGDGVADAYALDMDGDGVDDAVYVDTDGDGVVDTIQYDSDGDGIIDDEIVDIDGDGQFGSVGDELERDYEKKFINQFKSNKI